MRVGLLPSCLSPLTFLGDAPVLARRSKEAAQAISDGVFFSFQLSVHLPPWVTGGLFRPEYEDSHEGLSLRLTDGAGETDRFQAN